MSCERSDNNVFRASCCALLHITYNMLRR